MTYVLIRIVFNFGNRYCIVEIFTKDEKKFPLSAKLFKRTFPLYIIIIILYYIYPASFHVKYNSGTYIY